MSDRMNGEFYVGDDGRTIFKAPVSKPQPGGGISMAIGFPVCEVFEYVKNPEAVAKLLTLGEQADAPADCPKCKAIIEMLESEKKRHVDRLLAERTSRGIRRVAMAGAVHVIGASIVRARQIMGGPDNPSPTPSKEGQTT